MRAVFAAFFVAGVLATVVLSTPLTREKRYAGGFAAAGTPFGGGAFAGTGVGFSPFFGDGFPFGVFNVPMPVVPFPQMPVIPFPRMPVVTFPVFKNWYEGPNVCKEEKIMNSQMPDDVVPDDWKDDMPNVNTDFSHEQETCKGTDKKYVCVKRVMGNNGESQIKATKYECCHGFVRDPSGNPGCVESKQQNPSGAGQGSDGKLTANDPTYYIYTGNSGSSSSSMSSSSGNLDKVPLQ